MVAIASGCRETQARRVLVVGAGIAGLTLATALAQRGTSVDLIEVKASFTDNGGVGLSLVANAMRALDAIGIAEQCVAAGVPADSMALLRPDGSLLAENPLPRIGGPQWPGATGIARPVLHRILVEAAAAAGVAMASGTTITAWVETTSEVTATLSDGTAHAYDLIVCADGLYSQLRPQIMPGVDPAYTGQAVWRAGIMRPPMLDRTHIYLGGRHGVVGLCPVSAEIAYIYIVEAAPDKPWQDPATLHDTMRERLDGYGGLVADVAASLNDPAAVSYRPLDWILAPAPWGTARVRMIGDAVHANPPVLAQGAAMGIEDGVVLAEEFHAGGDLGEALRRFVARRRPRAAMVVEASCRLARWEVEHTPGVDVAAVMRSTAQALASPA